MSEMYDHAKIKWVWVEGISGVTSNTAYRVACDLCDVPVHPILAESEVGGKYLCSSPLGGDTYFDLTHVSVYDRILMHIDKAGHDTYEFYRALYPVETDVIVGKYPKKNHYVQHNIDTDQIIIHKSEVTYGVTYG